MFPELFKIPFTDVTIKSYGLMMVVGFLCAVWLIRTMAADITPDPRMITNAALYSLVSGVVGARVFYVIHYREHFAGRPLISWLAIWEGGLELLGGVLLAIAVIFAYLLYHRLPVRKYLDVLAVALFVALGFGRIGCFLNGCCYGKPTDLPLGVRFGYGSPAYHNQVFADPERGRDKPYLDLPAEYFTVASDGRKVLKPYEILTERQKRLVDDGPYRCLAVHPTQLYSSANAFLLAAIMYLFRRRSTRAKKKKLLIAPGSTFALMFILYGFSRFFIESLRDDNPLTDVGNNLTVSQNISLGLIVFGAVLMVLFAYMNRRPSAMPKR